MYRYPFALQLYSVRDHLEKDPLETLKAVRQCGYDAVELAGTAGLPAREFKKLLDAAGLVAISAHISYAEMTENTEAVLQDLRLFSAPFAVVPWIDPQTVSGDTGWAECAQKLAAAGALLLHQGIRLCYHNHEHEFAPRAGGTIFDTLFRVAPPEHLGIQLDAGWAMLGGADPAAIIRTHGTRVPIIHVKDYRRDPDTQEARVTELGLGEVVWDPVFLAAETAGVAWYIVEQDVAEVDSLQSAANNAAFMLRQNGVEATAEHLA